jgi:glucose-1-phosphate thymidylyltransferase
MRMQPKTGVILSGGRGTRLAPQTEIQNKHLLPVYGPQGAIPMIWYPLHTLVASGCDRIIIVSSQEHCGDIMEFLGDGRRFGVDICYKVQDHNDPARPVGIASAMKLIEGVVSPIDPFMVILGDNFYENNFEDEFAKFCDYVWSNSFRSDGIDTTHIAHVFLKEVHDPERFGVATIDGDKVTKIVEKPKNPESNYAVTGLYFFTGHVFNLLPKLTVSGRGELEVSDLNNWYVQNNKMTSTILKGFWHDLGTIPSMLHAQEWINKNNYIIPFK